MEVVDTITAAAAAAETASSKQQKDDTDALTGKVAEYYNKKHVFDFYNQVWGGEHLHVGLHTMLEGDDAKLEGVPRIAKASSVTTQELLSRFFPGDSGFVPDKCTIMDMGAGFGGTARVAAKELGCKVICIGISKQENDNNAALTTTAGLEDKVIIPGEKSYFDTGMPGSSCEVVCSQDALLHGGSQRHRAVAEAARVLKPGGRMVFTDVMRSDDATLKDLEEYMAREGANDLASVKNYQQWGNVYGLEFVEYVDYSKYLETDYDKVREVVLSRRGEQEGKHDDFLDHMAKGMNSVVATARRGALCWGFMVFVKPCEVTTD